MDPMMDVGMAPQATADTTLARYFQEIPSLEVPTGPSSWEEADVFRYDHAESGALGGRSITSWPYDNTQDHLMAHRPTTGDNESEFALFDHSHVTPSDTDSHGSSYSNDSIPPIYEANTLSDMDWQNFPVAYSQQGHIMLLPPLGLDSMNHGRRMNSIFKPSSVDMRAPTTVNPAAFQTSPSHLRVSGRVRSHPRTSLSYSSPSLPPLNGHTCVALSELSLPYIPEQSTSCDADSVLDPQTEPSTSSIQDHSRSAGSRSSGKATTAREARKQTKVKPYPSAAPAKAQKLQGQKATSSTRTLSDTSELSTWFVPDRPKRSVPTRPEKSATVDPEDSDDAGESEVTDTDGYTPSRSPSPDGSESDYSESGSLPPVCRQRKTSPSARRKTLSQMSAADALAHVSRSTSASSCSPAGTADSTDGSGSVSSARGTKSPPIPVPYLIKNSRGRKVPYVNDRTFKREDDSDDDKSRVRGGSSRLGRGRSRRNAQGRSFVCTVDGCGKCFVRGEHLKRHVRSIHTEERPHKCPYSGCRKSFSRRDNLGQHVRLHLLGSA